MDAFNKWMKEATPFDKSEVARLANTSLALLYQLTYGKRPNGKPFAASADLAGRIAGAISEVNSRSRHTPLPVVGRGDIAASCRECPYYKSCKEYKE